MPLGRAASPPRSQTDDDSIAERGREREAESLEEATAADEREEHSDQEVEPPPPPTAAAAAATRARCGRELAVGTRLEVRWTIEEVTVWWPCTVVGCESDGQPVGRLAPSEFPPWTVDYDAMPEVGYDEPERRTVILVGRNLLVDVAESDESDEGAGLMQWRAEGESLEVGELLHVGTPIKARWQGGEVFHAGRIAAINFDGTYTVDYSDGQVEPSVARELIEVVEMPIADTGSDDDDSALYDDNGGDGLGGVAAPGGGDVVGTDAMFDLVIGRLVRGPTFSSLPRDKQLEASSRIAELKELFEVELDQIKVERGMGAVVTQDDVMKILPRILQANMAGPRS